MFKKGEVPWNKNLKGKEYKEHFKKESKCHGGCNKKLSYWGYCKECVEKRKHTGYYSRIGKEAHIKHPNLARNNWDITLKKYPGLVKEWGRKGGNRNYEKHPDFGSLYAKRCNELYPDLAKYRGKLGWAATLTKYPDHQKKIAVLGGMASTKKYGGWAWVDSSENLKKMREKKPYYYKNVPHDSNAEKNVSKIFHDIGMPLVIGETVHVRIGNKEIDWRVKGLDEFDIKDGTFVEYHPCPQYHDERTYDEYYEQRRKVLDDNGYGDDLIVFTSINEVKMVFNETKQKQMESG